MEKLLGKGVSRKESWTMMGDFNEILSNEEKSGGPRRSEISFQPFAEMLSGCGMIELPGSGNSFTWGGKIGDGLIQSNMDRCFGNKQWFHSFSGSNQAFLEKRGSDHRPVLIKLAVSQQSYKGSFRFDKHLLHKPRVWEKVEKAWKQPDHLFGFSMADRLRSCRKALRAWKKENDLNSRSRIRNIQFSIEEEFNLPPPSYQRIQNVNAQMIAVYKDEESFWQQKK